MTKFIQISGIKHVLAIIEITTPLFDWIMVTDHRGRTAQANSVLGLMSLDHSRPLQFCGDDAAILEEISDACLACQRQPAPAAI